MEFISLASGASYFNSPEVAKEAAIKAIQHNKTFYSLAQGSQGLREALANRYLKLNNTLVLPEQILITPGTKFALYTILHQILKPGDEVIAPIPNWPGFHEVLQLFGVKLVLLPTSPTENYTINPDKLRDLLTPKTKLFLFSNPSNPTGHIFQKLEIESLLAVLQNYPDIYVLSDEIYDLVTFGTRVPSLAEFPDPHSRHLIVNGFSKNFAMSGWRIGYLMVPPALMPGCVQFQDITFSGVSEFVQEAAREVIQNLNTILPTILPVFEHNRRLITEFLKAENIPCYFPDATYYVFPDFSAYYTSEISTDTAFAHYLKENYGLEIKPGEQYGATGYARLSFAIETPTLEMALTRIKEALIRLKKGKN